MFSCRPTCRRRVSFVLRRTCWEALTRENLFIYQRREIRWELASVGVWLKGSLCFLSFRNSDSTRLCIWASSSFSFPTRRSRSAPSGHNGLVASQTSFEFVRRAQRSVSDTTAAFRRGGGPTNYFSVSLSPTLASVCSQAIHSLVWREKFPDFCDLLTHLPTSVLPWARLT